MSNTYDKLKKLLAELDSGIYRIMNQEAG